MSEIALSTGCFIGHETSLEAAGLRAVELSSHRSEPLAVVLTTLRRGRVRILSVHAPCPNRGSALDLAAAGARRRDAERALREAFAVARGCGARFVLAHGFYCIDGELPADDGERRRCLRRVTDGGTAIGDYVRSEGYGEARRRTVANLKAWLPRLRRDFPRQRLMLENLNPRLGYGGIRWRDLIDVAAEFDGEVGLCLDVGHLTLAEAALGETMHQAVGEAGDLIWSVHLHQNFAGRLCVDRAWDAAAPDPSLQEVDPHFPLTARCRRSSGRFTEMVAADNSAFLDILQGAAHYAGAEEETPVAGAVPVERLLALVGPHANRVFEFDSRYAPLSLAIEEYRLALRGEHPRLGA